MTDPTHAARVAARCQRRLLGMQRAAFDNTFSAMSMALDQQETLVDALFAQAPFVPAEAREVLETWRRTNAENRSHFREAMDQSFDRLEELLDRYAEDESPGEGDR